MAKKPSISEIYAWHKDAFPMVLESMHRMTDCTDAYCKKIAKPIALSASAYFHYSVPTRQIIKVWRLEAS